MLHHAQQLLMACFFHLPSALEDWCRFRELSWTKTVQLPKKMSMSRWTWQAAETITSAAVSRVTGPAELNEMVQ
jgi:hypothetical protein